MDGVVVCVVLLIRASYDLVCIPLLMCCVIVCVVVCSSGCSTLCSSFYI